MSDTQGRLATDLRQGTPAIDTATTGTGGDPAPLRKQCEAADGYSREDLYTNGASASTGEDPRLTIASLTWDDDNSNLEINRPRQYAGDERDRSMDLQHAVRNTEHLRMFVDKRDPNHDNAVAAAKMPVEKRFDSMEFAACELAAQETTRKTLETAGLPFKPFDKEITERCRPQWEKLAADPAAMTKVNESVERGCESIRTTPYTEPQRGPATRGAGRPVGGGAPPTPAAERAPARA